MDQMMMKEYTDPFTGSKNARAITMPAASFLNSTA